MRPLRLVFADGGTTRRSEVVALVERSGFEVVGESPSVDHIADLVASRSADMVLVAGSPEFASAVSRLDLRVACMALAPGEGSAKEYVECGAFAVLTAATDPDLFSSMAQVAVARAGDLRTARKEAESLRDQLETRKVVERAKGVLMRRMGIPEDEAYRKMQRASQDENRKMREIADSILSAERLYDEQKAER